MNLKGIMLSEKGQSQWITNYLIPFKWHSQKDKTRVTENRSGARGSEWASVNWKGIAQKYPLRDRRVPYSDWVSD